MPFARRLSPSRNGARAFTLLELIVVIVILGVLAGIAIPTFLTSQSKARDAVTSESLAATAHNAAALAALDQAFSDGNFSTAASESNLTALSPGLLAATSASAVAYNSSTGAGYASRPGVNGASGATAFTLSYQISPDKQSAGLAVVAPSGNCLMDVVSLTSNQKPWSYADLGANCNGSVALAGPTQPTPSKVAPGTPTIVTGFSATVASGTAVNLAWTAPTTGAASYLVSWTGGGSQSVPGTATSVQITGLTPNTSYTFSIVAQNVSNVAGPSASAGPVTTWSAALSSPSGLSASAGSNTVSLSWSAVSNAVSYNVYRGSTFLASSSTPSYTDNTAQNGTTYSYQVSSVDSHGQEGAPSPAVSAKPLPPVPGQVTGLTATAGNASATLSWSALAGSASYNVYVGATLKATVSAPATTYTVTGLTNGQSYSFQVSSVDAYAQEGTPSAAVSATPITTASAPTALTLTPGQSTMAVSWTAPSSNGGSTISSYTVSISPAPTSGPATQSVTGTSASFANLVANTAYTISVVAVNGAGSSAAGTATSTTWNATPAAPPGVTATASGTSVTVSWTASPTPAGGSINSYSVYQGANLVGTVSAPTTTFTYDTGVSGTTYAYQATATDGHGQVSPASTAASTTTVPATPTGVAASPSSTSNTVVVSWTPSGGATSYTVGVSPAPPGGTTSYTTTATPWTTPALASGTVYTFTVKAVNAAGSSAASSSTTSQVSYAGVVLADGPIGYYRLNDAGNGTAVAKNYASGMVAGALGNGSYCITGANTGLTPSTVGTCTAGWNTGSGNGVSSPISRDATANSAYFGTNGGYVNLPAMPSSLPANGFTLEGWVNTNPIDSNNTGNWSRFFDFSNDGNGDGIWLSRYMNTNSESFGGRYTSGSLYSYNDSHAAMTPSSWHYIAASISSTGVLSMYEDGNLVATYPANSSTASTTQNGYIFAQVARAYAYIGRSHYTQDSGFNGYMEEMAIYPSALSATQIANHYAAR